MSEKRKGLGRGLSALIPEAPAARATSAGSAGPATDTVRTLSVSEIRPNRQQPRTAFDEAGLEELAASIRTQGLIQPLIVTPAEKGTYTLVAGERRWRAAQRAGLTTVPVVVRKVRDDRELLEVALVENLQRSDLNAIEEAEAYRTLQQNFGLTQEEIADRVGKGRSAVANTIRLLRLPEEIQDLLRTGELSPGQARPLLALADRDEQIRLALRAVRDALTARDMESLAGENGVAGKKGKRKKSKPVEPHAAAAAEKLTRELQTKVEIERRGAGGVVRIHFHSEEELIRLFDRLIVHRKGGA